MVQVEYIMYKNLIIIQIKMVFATLYVLEYDDEIKELSFFYEMIFS